MKRDRLPDYPLRITFPDGEQRAYDDEDEMGLDLEWYDSDEAGAKVEDSLGRPVIVRVEKFRVVWAELT